MAIGAQIDGNNIVQRVLEIPDEQVARAQEYLAKDILLGGTWIGFIEGGSVKNQPNIGDTYDTKLKAFVMPQPFPSWTLNGEFKWIAPTPPPAELADWDEVSRVWVPLKKK